MITPLDIENKKFSKQMMNGYNVEDVDDFLDELVVDYEKNYKELAEANDKIEKLTKDLEQYKNLEKTLQNTLVMAQTTAEEVKIAAKQQADQLIAEARNKASEIQQEENEASLKKLDEIEKQIAIKERRFEDVKKQFDVYKAKMESLLISQEELIKEINQDDYEVYKYGFEVLNNAIRVAKTPTAAIVTRVTIMISLSDALGLITIL